MEFISKNATCLDCGYRLAGLESRNCPECGRHFDPLNATTFNAGASPSGWRHWAKPPTQLECLTIMGLTLLGIVGSSGPARWGAGSICCVGILGVPIWIGILVIYIKRVVAMCRDADRATRDLNRRRHTLRWSVVPICALIIASTIATPWPLILRFAASESAFNQALHDFQLGEFKEGQWVGLYYIGRVDPPRNQSGRTTGFIFRMDRSFAEVSGFEFDPSPNRTTNQLTIRVAPSWYTWSY